MNEEPKDIKSIFAEALEKETPEVRAAYLDEACGSDKKLRAEVEALLESHDQAGSFLEAPAFDVTVTFDKSPLTEGPGTVIGPYKLLEKIGEGGMAYVYMAEQEKPIRRKVALKIIKLGMDTRQVIARFEVERQALAMMDHPNIAKVLDAGATETGRPYFVMELVTGVSITEYCDKNNLSTKDRLDLFMQVCSAVQHAHQKGIIHRDIKPTNVMVTHHDGKPVPKVIDFGIAKAINQRLTEKTLFTRYAHIIGTPAYMSPEQAEMSDVDVDTRTDIYSLGVLLYELLTGATPFGEEELRKAGYIEMQRIIRETEPLKPSTKLSTMGDALTGVAEHRKTNPDLLAKLVRGDLDWIVMKSLEKDRARRYEAADRLALDIQRHLEHRPVLAHAPSTTYRLHKFLRRHRSQVIAALAMLVVAGTITILSIRNRYQVRLAEAEGARQVNALSEARRLIATGDLAAARKTLRPILDSEHAGLEARILFAGLMVGGHDSDEALKGTEAIMERHYRERVQYYVEKIQANPTDANNYLQRAQQHHYLHEEQNVHADMRRYAAILGGGPSLYFRFGAPRDFRRVVNGPFDCQLVFSVERRENGIQVLCIAFGQKGRCEMKLFEIPMLVTSLFGLCLLSGFDAPPVYADFMFGEPVKLGPVINSDEDVDCFSSDGLEMYIGSGRPGGYGDWDVWVLRRTSTDDNWGPPENLGPAVNSSMEDSVASISTDGLSLYFNSNRPGGYGGYDAYMTTRPTKNSPWGQAVNLGPNINGSANEAWPSISPDGLELYLGLIRSGGYGSTDIYVARRETESDPWGVPVNLGPVVNSRYGENWFSLSPDGLLLLFCDNPSASPRPGGYGNVDIWMARRARLSDPWQAPVNLGPQVNGPGNEGYARISSDGRTLFFRCDRGGSYDNWQVPILPLVDLYTDFTVEMKDFSKLAQYWGQDEPSVDIGPMPWGDGVVDIQDVAVLLEYWLSWY